jgi:hypothetical protein
VLANRGALLIESGDLVSARRDLTECIRLAHDTQLLVLERGAIHNLGYLEFIAGDLPLALRTMDEGMALDGQTQVGIALLDRARVLLAAGLRREADESLAAAARQLAKDRCWQDVGEVELARAEAALLVGELAAARRMAVRARTRFRRQGNDRWRRNAELVLLQADLTAGRPAARLLQHAEKLAAEFAAAGFEQQSRTSRLLASQMFLSMGDRQSAVGRAEGALMPKRADPISLRLQTRLVRAQLELAADQRASARRQIRAGMTELADYQAQFSSLDLQTASAVHGRQLAELDVATALADGGARGLLEAVERGRATSARLLPVQPPQDPQVASLLTELRRSLDNLKSLESDPGASKAADVERSRVAELQRRLRGRSWQVGGSGAAARPAALSDIRSAIQAAGSVLICYVQIGDVLHAVVDGAPGGARIHELGSAAAVAESVRRLRFDLDALAGGNLPEPLLTAVQASMRRSCEVLDDRLLRPLRLSDQRLVIVPTGPLKTLPWTNLPSMRARPVVVAPSATSWLTASTAPAAPAGDRIVAMAGPGLDRADEEVKAIGELWSGSAVVTGQGASRHYLAAAMSSARIVHVAAHGEHQAENPLFSSIQLADGPLFAYELDQSSTAAEHVILSACELGLATVRPGDEALGLTSVLLHLGTRCVISGVARVHDAVAADVMARYHRALSTGADSAQALAEACAAEDSMPAPFVCFGAAWRS